MIGDPMRRTFAFALPIVALAAFAYACEDGGSSSGGGSPFDPDGGGGFEASTPDFDASAPDGAVLPDAAPSGPVTVVVQRAIGVAAGVTVIFHDAAGAVTEVKKTGADGKATSGTVVPAMATVLLGGGSNRRLLTYTSLQPGDEVFVRDALVSESLGSVLVQPQGTFDGVSNRYAYLGNCQGYPNGPNDITLYLESDCLRASNSVLAVGLSGGTSLPLAWAFKKGVTPAPDGGTMPNILLGPWTAAVNFDVNILNAPPGISETALSLISEGNGYRHPIDGTTRTGKTTYAAAAGFAEAYQGSARYSPPIYDGASSVLVAVRAAAPKTSIDVDLGSALPIIDTADIDGTNPKRPKASWHSVAPLTAAKGGSIFLDWYDNRDESHGWAFIVPPDATTLTAPVLPPEAGPWAPLAEGDGGSNASWTRPSVLFADSSLLPNAAAFRREAGRVVPYVDNYERDTRALLPADGTLRTTHHQLQLR